MYQNHQTKLLIPRLTIDDMNCSAAFFSVNFR